MGVHDTHSGAQPDPAMQEIMQETAQDGPVIEAKARLWEIEEYENAGPSDKAFWLGDTAKTAVGLLYHHNLHQAHLLLDGTITVRREGDFMVARFAPNPMLDSMDASR